MDASNKVMAEADTYFLKFTGLKMLKEQQLIKIGSLKVKSDIVLALKLNELALLDHICLSNRVTGTSN